MEQHSKIPLLFLTIPKYRNLTKEYSLFWELSIYFFLNLGIFLTNNKNMKNKFISGKNIVERMKKFKELKEYSEVLDIPIQTISNWKTRDSAPKSEQIYKIARFLGVSVDWLLTGESSEGLSVEDRDFLNKLNSLNSANKNAVLSLLNTLYQQEENDIEKKNQIG